MQIFSHLWVLYINDMTWCRHFISTCSRSNMFQRVEILLIVELVSTYIKRHWGNSFLKGTLFNYYQRNLLHGM